MRGGDGAGERVGSKPLPPSFFCLRDGISYRGGSRKLRDGGPGGLTFMILGGFYDFGRKVRFALFAFIAPKRLLRTFRSKTKNIGHGPRTLL